MNEQELYVGIDLGATKTDIGILDRKGQPLGRILIPTRTLEGAEAIVEDLVAAIKTLKERGFASIRGVGIGVAGQVTEKGVVSFAPNLGWNDFPLKDKLRQKTGLPCHVLNDVRAAAYGEWVFGAGQGCRDLFCIYVGSGIGGAAISSGQLITGHTNSACEIGHMVVELDGPLCGCGNHGCFEALAGGWGIARRAQEAILKDPEAGKQMLDRVEGKVELVTAKEVFAAYQLGSPLALRIIEKAQKALAAGICSLVNAFNPQRIILGGGIMERYSFLVESVQERVPQIALKIAVKDLEIVKGKLKADAGVIGAAAYGFMH